ncbi:MAG: hypothetical protein KKB87_07070, partial [Alphaproteobacteria bacterium]|nr:hypothetical protein [Alphaproteobacteria bacterium]
MWPSWPGCAPRGNCLHRAHLPLVPRRLAARGAIFDWSFVLADVVIYTKPGCGYCHAAKDL